MSETNENTGATTPSHSTRYPDSCSPRVSCMPRFHDGCIRTLSGVALSRSTLDALFLHSFNHVVWTSVSTRSKNTDPFQDTVSAKCCYHQ